MHNIRENVGLSVHLRRWKIRSAAMVDTRRVARHPKLTLRRKLASEGCDCPAAHLAACRNSSRERAGAIRNLHVGAVGRVDTFVDRSRAVSGCPSVLQYERYRSASRRHNGGSDAWDSTVE